jgi:hypothetical protein
VVLGAIAAILIAIVLVVVAFAGGDDDDESGAESSGEVQLEPISSNSPNPFTANVGTDLPNVTPPAIQSASGAQTYTGGTAGLYGGTQNNASCNTEQLVTFLEANPDKARAWAGTLGIQPTEIRSYVATLTSVVLRADTRVTNHGYFNGRATEINAVLQAGTAVLVDKYGTPVVKCFCGNPLTPPKPYTTPIYTGTRWPTFQPTSVIVVVKNEVVINDFYLVDPTTNRAFGRPAGGNGSTDGPPPTDDSSSSSSSSSSTTTRPRTTAANVDGTYNLHFSDACGFGVFDIPMGVQRSGTSLTFTFTSGGGSATASGTIAADNSFSGGGTTEDGSYTIKGTFTPSGATVQVAGTVADSSCSADFTGQRG